MYGKTTEIGLGGPNSWVGQALRESPGQVNSVNLIDGNSDMASSCHLCERKAQKRKHGWKIRKVGQREENGGLSIIKYIFLKKEKEHWLLPAL